MNEKDVRKLSIFSITILSISVVVFNNLTDIIQKIFIPEFQQGIYVSFGLITLGVTTYTVINKNMLNQKGEK